MIRFQQDSSRSVLWQVLAPYVRWPLHSPKRLLATAFAVLVLFAACGRLQGGGPAGAPGATATTTVTQPAPAWTHKGSDGTVTVSAAATDPATGAASGTATPGSGPSVGVTTAPIITTAPSIKAPTPTVPKPSPFTPPPPAATPTGVAEQFVTAWARRGATVDDWLSGVNPYVTPEFGAELLSTDPDRVPATRRTGPATVTARTPQSVTLTVPTDGVAVRVTVKRVGTSWLVSGIEPVPAAEAAPTPDVSPAPATPTP